VWEREEGKEEKKVGRVSVRAPELKAFDRAQSSLCARIQAIHKLQTPQERKPGRWFPRCPHRERIRLINYTSPRAISTESRRSRGTWVYLSVVLVVAGEQSLRSNQVTDGPRIDRARHTARLEGMG
jgi:hypothetical protein